MEKIDETTCSSSKIAVVGDSQARGLVRVLCAKDSERRMCVCLSGTGIGEVSDRLEGVLAGYRPAAVRKRRLEAIAFFFKNFNNAETKYSAFDRELQLTADIRYVKDADNAPAVALSRNISAISSLINYVAIAADQDNDSELQQLQENAALKMKKIQLSGNKEHLYADVSTVAVWPYIPKQHRYHLFRQLYDLSYPDIRTSQHMVTSRFIWDGINKDVRQWTRTCIKCQTSKVTRHTHTLLQQHSSNTS